MKYSSQRVFQYTIVTGFLFSILSRTQTFSSIIPATAVFEIIIFSTILAAGLYINKKLTLQKNSFILLILLTTVFLYAVASAFWAEYPRLTAQRAFIALTLPIAILFIVAIDNQRKDTFKLISNLVVFFGSVFAIIGIVLYFFGELGTSGGRTIQYLTIGPIEVSQDVYGRQNRISSVLGNPNTLAGFFVASIPLTLLLIFESKNKSRYSILIVLQLISLILSGSRNGLFAVMSGVIIITVLISLKRLSESDSLPKLNLKSITATAFIAALIPITTSILTEQRSLDVSSEALEGAGRVEMWSAIWYYTIENPQGTGFGISREAIPGVVRSPHSDYFAVLGELGLVGVLLFSLLIGMTVWYGLRKYVNANTNDGLYLAGAIAIFLAFTIHGFAETSIIRGGGRQVFWAYFLAYIACHSNPTTDNNS